MKNIGIKKKVKRIFITKKKIGISMLLILISFGPIFYTFWNEKLSEEKISIPSIAPATLLAKQGFDYYLEGDLPSAINSFQEALNSEGKKPLYWIVLADIYIENEKTDLALETLNEGLMVNPNNELLLIKTILVLEREEENEDAINFLLKYLETNPRQFNFLSNQKDYFEDLGYSEIVAELCKYLFIHNKDMRICEQYVDILLEKKRSEDALEYLNELIQKFSNPVDILLLKAKVLESMDRKTEKLLTLSNVLEIDPNILDYGLPSSQDLMPHIIPDRPILVFSSHPSRDLTAHLEWYNFRLKYYYYLTNDDLPCLEALIESYPQCWHWYHMKSRTLLSLQSISEAVETTRDSLKIMPNDRHLWDDLIYYLKLKDSKYKILDAYDEAINTFIGSPDFLIKKAQFLHELGRTSEAIETLDKSIDLNPTNIETYKVKISILMHTSSVNDVLNVYKIALEKTKWDSEVLKEAKDFLLERHRYKETFDLLDEAFLVTEDPIILVRKGDLLLEVGEYGKATSTYYEALRAGATDIDLFKGLAKSLEKLYRYNELNEILNNGLIHHSESTELLEIKLDLSWVVLDEDEKLEIYEKMVKIDPDNLFYWKKLVEIYKSRENHNKAVEMCEMAFKTIPYSLEPLTWKAEILYQTDDLLFYESLEKILSFGIYEPHYWKRKADICNEYNRMGESIYCLTSALILDPLDFWTAEYKASLLKESDQIDRAKEAYEKYLWTQSQKCSSGRICGIFMCYWICDCFNDDLDEWDISENPDAMAVLDELLESNPYDPNLWMVKYNTCEYNKSCDMWDILNTALRYNPQSPGLHVCRIVFLGNQEELEKLLNAIDESLSSLELDKHQKMLLLKLKVWILYNLERYEELPYIWDLMLAIDPYDTEVWWDKVYILKKIEDYDSAFKTLDLAKSHYLDAFDVVLAKAFMFEDTGRYEEAIEAIDWCISYMIDHDEEYHASDDSYIPFGFFDFVSLEYLIDYKATIFFRNGDIEKALKIYEYWLNIFPDGQLLWREKIEMLCSLSRYDEAYKDYLKIMNMASFSSSYLLDIRELFFEFDAESYAVESLDELMKRDDLHYEARKMKSDLLIEMKKPEEALSLWNEAIRMKPFETDFLLEKAMLLVDLDRFDESIQTFNEIIKISGFSEEFKSQLCSFLHHLDDINEALIFLDSFIQLYPNNIELYETKIDVLQGEYQSLQTSHHDEIIDVYDQIIKNFPHRPAYYRKKIYMLSELNQTEAQIVVVDQAMQNCPESLSFHDDKLQFLLENEDFSGILELYRELLEKFPKENYLLGNLLEESFNFLEKAERIKIIDEIVKISPENVPLLIRVVKVLRDIDDVSSTIEISKLVLNMDPENSEILELLIEDQMKLEMYAEALNNVEKLEKVNPSRVNYSLKGDLLCRLDRKEEALEAYGKVLNVNPSNVYAIRRKITLFSEMEREEDLKTFLKEIIEKNLKRKEVLKYVLEEMVEHFKSKGNLEEELFYIKWLLYLDPDNINNWNRKAAILLSMGRGDEAFATLHFMIGKYPTESSLYITKAELLDSLGRTEEALQVLETGIQNIDSESYKLALYRKEIEILKIHSRLEEALEVSMEAVKHLTELQREKAHLDQAEILRNLGQFEEAIFVLENLVEKTESEEIVIGAYLKECETFAELLQYDKAIDCLDEALEKKPDDYSIMIEKARLLGSVGKYEEELLIYEEIIEEYPDLSLWEKKKICLDNMGKYDEILEMYDLMISHVEDPGWILIEKVRFAEKIGKLNEYTKCRDLILENAKKNGVIHGEREFFFESKDRVFFFKISWINLKRDPLELSSWGQFGFALLYLPEVGIPVFAILYVLSRSLYKRYFPKWVGSNPLIIPLSLGILLVFLYLVSRFQYTEHPLAEILFKFYMAATLLWVALIIYRLLNILIGKKMTIRWFLAYSILLTVEIIIIFAFIYFAVATQEKYGSLVLDENLQNPSETESGFLISTIYYSVVTYFSLGYGDICPVGWLRLISMIEVFLGYFMTVFIISMGVSKYGLKREKSERRLKKQFRSTLSRKKRNQKLKERIGIRYRGE